MKKSEKNTGHVSGTLKLGLQIGAAGHNLDGAGGDALKLALGTPSFRT